MNVVDDENSNVMKNFNSNGNCIYDYTYSKNDNLSYLYDENYKKKGEFYGLYGLQQDDESSIVLNG